MAAVVGVTLASVSGARLEMAWIDSMATASAAWLLLAAELLGSLDTAA